MDNQSPLDLRSLGEVDSPEVVSAALRQFRRRMVRRNLWIALLVVIAVGAFLNGKTHQTLPDRIEHAPTTYTYAAWNLPGGTVQLRSVSDLGGTTGLTFVVIGDAQGKPVFVAPPNDVIDDVSTGTASYFEIPKSADGIITMVLVPHQNESRNIPFTIDLHALDVPPTEWRITP